MGLLDMGLLLIRGSQPMDGVWMDGMDVVFPPIYGSISGP
nr:hypothetical protein Q903MT_gene6073 [Picea sitchensis]